MSESSPSRDYMQSGAQAEDPYLSRIQQRNRKERTATVLAEKIPIPSR